MCFKKISRGLRLRSVDSLKPSGSFWWQRPLLRQIRAMDCHGVNTARSITTAQAAILDRFTPRLDAWRADSPQSLANLAD
jgi:hypothetical protein